MSPDGPPRILVVSSRPDIVADVERAAARLEPPLGASRLTGRPAEGDLVLVDIAEPRATAASLRRRFGRGPALVALIEAVWVSRLGDALAGEWDDYLFYPLNLDELGLLRRRFLAPGAAPELSLDVDDEGHLRLVIPSDVRYQRPAVERLVEACRHLAHLDPEAVFRLRVALGEALANAILYGSGEGSGAVVRIDAEIASGRLRVRVRDEGSGFDPSEVPDPTAPEGLEKSRGRGLFLLRHMCDEVRFNESGNEISLVFRGALDPVTRIRPWLADFSGLTGLRFRLERHGADGIEPIFDAWAAADEPVPGALEVRPVGTGELRLHVPPAAVGGSGRDRALPLLEGWLGAIAEGDEARERLLERRMRRARVLAELEVARDLQLRLLPSPESFAAVATVAARCEPALSLGGDFYYLVRLPGGRLGVMLGDVSSHGPSAALLMALTLSAAAVVTRNETSPAAALDALREQLLSALASTEMYMTLFYGVLHPGGDLAYANAGHAYAYRLAGGRAERLEALDPPLGMGEGSKSREAAVPWGAADTLVVFTDGLAEVGDPFADPTSPLRRLAERGATAPDRLIEALFAGTEDELRLDDRTAVAVRW